MSCLFCIDQLDNKDLICTYSIKLFTLQMCKTQKIVSFLKNILWMLLKPTNEWYIYKIEKYYRILCILLKQNLTHVIEPHLVLGWICGVDLHGPSSCWRRLSSTSLLHRVVPSWGAGPHALPFSLLSLVRTITCPQLTFELYVPRLEFVWLLLRRCIFCKINNRISLSV